MAIQELWSEQQFGVTSARRVFEIPVSEAETEDDARAALPDDAKYNGAHPRNANLLAGYPNISTPNYGLWRIEVNYAQPDGGGSNPDPNDPLNSIPRISWERVTITEQSDYDINGVPIRNAAGDPPSNRLTRESFSRVCKIFFNLASYPFDLADIWEGVVSNSDVTLTNSAITFAAEKVKCLTLMPASEYPANAAYVPMVLTLEVRSWAYPFRPRLVNQGRNGWYNDSGTTRRGPISTKDASTGEWIPVTEDELLDVNGKPLDTALKIGKGGAAPVNNPTAVTGYALDPDAPPPALLMMWEMDRRMDLNTLFAALGL